MEKTEELMRCLAVFINDILKKECSEKMGFTLLVFPFGKEQVANYISNTLREDMIKVMRETADRLEKREGIMPPTINKQII